MNGVTSPTEQGLLKESFNPANLASGQDLMICDLVLPREVTNGSKLP